MLTTLLSASSEHPIIFTHPEHITDPSDGAGGGGSTSSPTKNNRPPIRRIGALMYAVTVLNSITCVKALIDAGAATTAAVEAADRGGGGGITSSSTAATATAFPLSYERFSHPSGIRGMTLLHAAVSPLHQQSTTTTSTRGGSSNIPPNKFPDPSILRLILRTGAADPHAEDYSGHTPLHYAAAAGAAEHFSILIEEGLADPLARADNGETPLSVAERIVEKMSRSGGKDAAVAPWQRIVEAAEAKIRALEAVDVAALCTSEPSFLDDDDDF